MLAVARLLAVLKEHRLLLPGQLAEAEAMQAQFSDAQALAQELVRRDWLTPFQVHHLLQDQAPKLLFGPYLLLRRLGEGGMGRVFQARHQRLGRTVALKFIRPELVNRPVALARFQREAQAAAQLSHPNVVTLYDADQVDDTHFCSMEFVDGLDLAQLIKEHGPWLPIALACDYIRQAALGLQHAHEHGLVHRDIKPGNLMVTRQGVVKILDLGLARGEILSTHGSSTASVTEEGVVIGTVDYMAPEQAKNAKGVDARADLYSLGCTLYHLLAGQPPFTEGLGWEKLQKHQTEEAVPVEHLRAEVPVELAGVVRKLLAKRPEQRYQSGAEVAAALATFCQAGTAAALPLAQPPVGEVPPLTTPDPNQVPTVDTRARPPGSSNTRLAGRRSVGVRSLGKKVGLVLLCLVLVGAGGTWLVQHLAQVRPTAEPPPPWPQPPLGLEALSYLPPSSSAFAVVRPGRVAEPSRDKVKPLFAFLHQLGMFDFAPGTGLDSKDVDHEAYALYADLLHLKGGPPGNEPRGILALKMTRPLAPAQKQQLLQAIGADPAPLRLQAQGLPYHALKTPVRRTQTEPKFAYLPNDQLLVFTNFETSELGMLPGLKDPPPPYPADLEPLWARLDNAFLCVFGTFEGHNRKLVEKIKLSPILILPQLREQTQQILKRARAFSIWLTWGQGKVELGVGLQCHDAQDAAQLANTLNRGLVFGKLVVNLVTQNLPIADNFLPVLREWVDNIQFRADHGTFLILGSITEKKMEKLLAGLGP